MDELVFETDLEKASWIASYQADILMERNDGRFLSFTIGLSSLASCRTCIKASRESAPELAPAPACDSVPEFDSESACDSVPEFDSESACDSVPAFTPILSQDGDRAGPSKTSFGIDANLFLDSLPQNPPNIVNNTDRDFADLSKSPPRYPDKSLVHEWDDSHLLTEDKCNCSGDASSLTREKINIFYNTEGLISLENYCKRNTVPGKDAPEKTSPGALSSTEAKELLKTLKDNINWCRENLLNPFCLLTDPAYIFLSQEKSNSDSTKVASKARPTFIMLYLPLNPDFSDFSLTDSGQAKSLKFMLSEKLLELLPFNDNQDSPAYQDILGKGCLKLDFESYAASISKEEISDAENKERQISKSLSSPGNRLKEILVKPSSVAKLPNSLLLLIFFSSHLIFIFIAYLSIKRSALSENKIPFYFIVFLVFLILSASDLFLLAGKGSPFRKALTALMQGSAKEENHHDRRKRNQDKTVSIVHERIGDKMAMLSDGLPGSMEEAGAHKGFILSDDFLIGRDAGKADFIIKEGTVGRLHARITRVDNSFFIEDLGSANGTFVDRVKIGKGQSMPLPDKCLIAFADKEYYFVAD